jgi:hypothetical protein
MSERHVVISTFTIRFCLIAFLSQACGHKHVHNKRNFLLPSFHIHVAISTFTIFFFPLLPSFHSPWIIVTVIDYIDNKRNSIAILFLWCHKYSRWLGWARFFCCCHNYNNERFGFFFSCCHKYIKWWNLFARFFLVAIITIMEGLGFFFCWCHKYPKWWNLFARFFFVAIITIMEGLGFFFLLS